MILGHFGILETPKWGAPVPFFYLLGRPGEIRGRPCELEAFLGALAFKKASRIHKDAPISPQDVPKGRKMGPVHPIDFGVSGGPKMTPNLTKSESIINNMLEIRKR